MSDVKRWDMIGQGDCEMAEYPDGPYVRYEDFNALALRLDALTADRDQWKGRADQLQEERDGATGRRRREAHATASSKAPTG